MSIISAIKTGGRCNGFYWQYKKQFKRV